MPRLCETELCTGCSACASACPYGCIAMAPDSEGFVRPAVDEKRCMDCGLCVKACPVLNARPTHGMPRAYAAKNRNETIRAVSTSGGVFTLLAQQMLEEGGVVVGAAFDADFRVEHQIIENPQLLPRLRGAKYAQSDVRGVFPRVKAFLAEGRQVLFSGTPCQVAGLKSYLGREEPGLLLVDMVCHGVPSPAVWESYLDWRSTQSGEGLRPIAVNLRSKDHGWRAYSADIRWPYGKSYLGTRREDPFLRAYEGDLCLRPSCYRCANKGLTRCADFTLGDFWGVGEHVSSMDDDRGTSVVLVHSEKARQWWEKLAHTLSVQEVDARRCMERNPSALQSAPFKREDRALFMHRYEREDLAVLVDELLPRKTGSGDLAQRMTDTFKRLFRF